MAVTQYIGARYVPLFAEPAEWTAARTYEPLTIVLHQGDSYTSRQFVPQGIDIADETYWAHTGSYNAQVEQYRSEVRAFDGRITQNANDIDALESDLAAETQARTQADTALGTRITNEQTARTQADSALDTRITNEQTARAQAITAETQARTLADAALENTIDSTKTDLIENYHQSTYQDAFFTVVDSGTGNDNTGRVRSASYPFKTLEKAFEAVSERGNDLRFRITRAGTYYLPARLLIGTVLHLFSTVPNVTVIVKNDYGNLFAYDSHINLRCEDESGHIKFIVGQNSAGDVNRMQFECEGSTLWTNRAEIECNNLYMIQGSMSLTNTIVRANIDAWFSLMRFYNLTINNTNNAPALNVMVGKVRIENQPFTIGSNSNAGDNPAIYLRDSTIRFNNQFSVGAGWAKTMYAGTSVVYASDAYWNNWNGETSGGIELADNTIRSKGVAVIPA